MKRVTFLDHTVSCYCNNPFFLVVYGAVKICFMEIVALKHTEEIFYDLCHGAANARHRYIAHWFIARFG